MCYHVSLKFDNKKLSQSLGIAPSVESVPQGVFNAFDFPQMAILGNNNVQQLQIARWGLLPPFADVNFNRVNTLNARIETLEEKKSFKNSIKYRCLIPVSAFFEWKWLDGKGNRKQKFKISGIGDFLFLGGLFSEVNGQMSFSIVTTVANELMSEIHNIKKRMPLILTKENKGLWLEGGDLQDFYICDPQLKAISDDLPNPQLSLF
ncbi:MAG TPA: SOS response-associated peptidase family protein [Edaphocola sp.]|nr:SOS response-associated peptidase family protein [Edaphocola sp.]